MRVIGSIVGIGGGEKRESMLKLVNIPEYFPGK